MSVSLSLCLSVSLCLVSLCRCAVFRPQSHPSSLPLTPQDGHERRCDAPFTLLSPHSCSVSAQRGGGAYVGAANGAGADVAADAGAGAEAGLGAGAGAGGGAAGADAEGAGVGAVAVAAGGDPAGTDGGAASAGVQRFLPAHPLFVFPFSFFPFPCACSPTPALLADAMLFYALLTPLAPQTTLPSSSVHRSSRVTPPTP